MNGMRYMTEIKGKISGPKSKRLPRPGKSKQEVSAQFKSALLKAEEVCRIISTCATSNVAVLKYGDLYVRFGPNTEPGSTKGIPSESPSENLNYADPGPSPSDTAISENATKIERETHARDELNLREQQIQESAITDPLEFENMLASGELEDDGTEEA